MPERGCSPACERPVACERGVGVRGLSQPVEQVFDYPSITDW